MKTILITFLLVFSFLKLHPQYKELDKLKVRLANAKEDSTRVMILNAFEDNYKFTFPDSGIYYGRQALSLARKIQYSKREARALYQLGVANRTLGNSVKSLEFFFKSIQISEKNNFVEINAWNLLQIGVFYYGAKRYSKASTYFHQVVNSIYSPEIIIIKTVAFNQLALLQLSLKNIDSAVYYAKLCLDNIEKYNIDLMRSRYLKTIGMIYFQTGEIETALVYLKNSLHTSSLTQSESNLENAKTNCDISKIYQKTHHPDSAIYYAERSLEIGKSGKFYSSIIESSKLLAELF